MPADTPGRRVKVLAAGLRQLGLRCEAVSGELSAAAAVPPASASSWQTNAAVVNASQAEACADLAIAASRLEARAEMYTKAASDYTTNEQHAAVQFTVLVRR